MYRAFDAGVDLVESLVKSENIDCDFTRSGKLKLAAKREHFDKLVRAQEVLAREVDADTAIVAKQDLGQEIATERYHGGLLQRRSASMHMGKFGTGIAHAAARSAPSGSVTMMKLPTGTIRRRNQPNGPSCDAPVASRT